VLRSAGDAEIETEVPLHVAARGRERDTSFARGMAFGIASSRRYDICRDPPAF
jgi:hypothetical protein